jgi:phosphopentomutase
MRPAQDDGEPTLLWAYRYIDGRLREVAEALDSDDVLIVMSDHGIRTALEHDEDAFFVAVGAGLSHGRVPGRPHLRGVPQLLATLLGVPADWPETGLVAALAPRQLASR